MNCPECGKRHRKYPSECFNRAQRVYGYEILAGVKNGTGYKRLAKMKTYVRGRVG